MTLPKGGFFGALVGDQEHGRGTLPQTPSFENEGMRDHDLRCAPWLFHEVSGVTTATRALLHPVIHKGSHGHYNRISEPLVKKLGDETNTP